MNIHQSWWSQVRYEIAIISFSFSLSSSLYLLFVKIWRGTQNQRRMEIIKTKQFRLNISSQKGMDRCSSQLDLAYIFFFQQLRKSYIGEHALRATNFYVRLSEVLSLSDQEAVCGV